MQRVVERPQVRVDLLVERAGQEAEPLARLDRRPGQDDPVDLLGLQRLHRLGHRQVGLAGAGRADAEDDGVLVDRVDVALLAQRLGADGAPAPGEDVERQHLGGPLGGALLEHADGAPDGVGGQRLALLDQLEQLGEEALGEGVVGRRAGDGDLVAADVHVAGDRALDELEDLVAWRRAGSP